MRARLCVSSASAFGQAVGERLGHQGVVVVIVFFKFCDERFDAQSRGDREHAEIIHAAALPRRDEIRHGVAGFLVGSRQLLPQRVERREQMARFVRVDFDVVLHAVRGEKSDHGARFEQFFAHDASEQLLPVVEQLFRFRADAFLLENFRINPAQLPGMEKRRPVDVGNDFFERHRIVHARSEERRPRRLVRGPIVNGLFVPRLRERQERLRLPRGMFFPRALLFLAVFFREMILHLGAEQIAHDADGARCVLHVDDRLAVRGRDFHRRVRAAGRGAADQQRNGESFALHFLRDVRHFLERRRDEAAQADQMRRPFRARFSESSRPAPSRRGRSLRSCCSPARRPRYFCRCRGRRPSPWP